MIENKTNKNVHIYEVRGENIKRKRERERERVLRIYREITQRVKWWTRKYYKKRLPSIL